MADVTRYREAVVKRVLDGKGKASPAQRRAAFDNVEVAGPARELVDKVVHHAHKITDEDVAAVKQTLSEDEIFELVVCAAIGQATRQLDAALAVLDDATREPA